VTLRGRAPCPPGRPGPAPKLAGQTRTVGTSRSAAPAQTAINATLYYQKQYKKLLEHSHLILRCAFATLAWQSRLMQGCATTQTISLVDLQPSHQQANSLKCVAYTECNRSNRKGDTHRGPGHAHHASQPAPVRFSFSAPPVSGTCRPSCRMASSRCSLRNTRLRYTRFSSRRLGQPSSPRSGSPVVLIACNLSTSDMP